MTAQHEIYIHSRNGGMTIHEYDTLHEQLADADARGDEKEYDRISRLIPITADVAKAIKEVYGRDFIIASGFDVTEANMKFGEGWLDE